MRILVLLFLIFGISEAEINRGMRLVMEKEPKIAFLVANSKYRQSEFFRDLKNPKNDVQAIAKKLKKLGFRVMTGYNLSDIALQKKLKRFYSFLKRAENGVGLFYYAGHGIEVGGVNYLIPSDINVEEAEYVPYRATPLNPIIEKMEKTGKRLNIAVLDACRENPFESRGGIHKGGLASFSASGTFIAYSAESGKMASDGKGKFSPFAKAFLKHIEKPQKIEEFFKDVRRDVRIETHKNQTPATYNLIDGDFYFVLPKKGDDISYFPQKVSNYSESQKHRLYISITPNNARVRIMNINPKYRDGIDLGTDKALVEVTKSGYRKYLKWHRNLEDNTILDIELERKKVVRVEKPKNSYSSKSWRDDKTGLIWQKNISLARRNWKEAISYCKDLVYDGNSDWRLPTIWELKTLLTINSFDSRNSDLGKVYIKYPLVKSLKEIKYNWFWSIKNTDSIKMDFNTGLDNNSHQNKYEYVRCVR